MQLPPGPSTHHFIQSLQWIRTPFAFMDTCKARYGDAFTLRIIDNSPTVVVSTPASIRATFTAPQDVLDAGRANDLLAPFLGQRSLLILNGPPHHRHRRLMTPPLHGQRMRHYGEDIWNITDLATRSWAMNTPMTWIKEAQNISLQVILKVVFGVQPDSTDPLPNLLRSLLSSVTGPIIFLPALQRDLGPLSPGGRFRRLHTHVHTILQTQIDARRRRPNPDAQDVFSLLLNAHDEAGETMEDEEIREELLTLLVAGHETTATALSWALSWLLTHPDTLHTLLDELRPLGAEPDLDALRKLPYLDAVCREVLRIKPIVPVAARYAREDITLDTVEIPKDSFVLTSIHLAHHNTDLYPNPTAFQPERFLGDRPNNYAYFPFGGGSRRCIGMAFAMYQMKVILTFILTRFTLSLLDTAPLTPQRQNVTLAPKHGTRLQVVGRKVL